MQIVHPLVFERLPVHQFASYLDVKVLNWEGSIENFEVRLLMFLHKSIGKLGPSVEEDGLPAILEKMRRLNRILYKRRHLLLKYVQQCKMNSLIEY
ncbi:hypothetical protein T12_10649 [Trichinella patagoniensis]|uniref:Uncharacterized protein n=1 Tax=Trichinella patagoniensis TaxID=990121 RepID=A0A0V0ZF34_9BILA|nr:hypothetical protein T12_10649 [Trichinella patagoniensis]